MDLAYIYYSDYNVSKAHPIQIVETCNALACRGHDVTLYTPRYPSTFFDHHDTQMAFQVQSGRYKLPTHATDRGWYYLKSLLRAADSDVIFTRDVSFLKFLSMMPSFRRPPVVYEAHKVYHRMGEKTRSQEMRYLGEADSVVAISEGVREDLETLGVDIEDVITVGVSGDKIPNASGQELRAEHSIPHSEVVLVYAGNLEPWKNDLPLTVDAISALTTELARNVRLYMIGGTEDQRRDLQEYVDETDSAARIELLGTLPHREVFDYLKLSDVGLAPLRDTTTWNTKYTSPVKIHEYLTSGLSVVASEVEAVESNFGDLDRVYTYTVGDVESYKTALFDAVSDVGERSENETPDFSFERRAEKLSAVLEAATQK